MRVRMNRCSFEPLLVWTCRVGFHYASACICLFSPGVKVACRFASSRSIRSNLQIQLTSYPRWLHSTNPNTSLSQNMSFSGYRGGRKPWRGASSSKLSQGPIRTPPAPPLGILLEQLTPDQTHQDKHDSDYKLEITDTKFLASYNWTDAKDPSIIFPGKFKISQLF
jgi:hypothetical protein